MSTHRAGPLIALLALGSVPGPAFAQVRASEPASVSQTIDGTRITLEYSRPRARGRDSLFGKVVHWGEVWTPGANLATTLELTKDARIGGQAVAKGKYSVWLVVRKDAPWTMVLDPRHTRHHTEHPDSTAQQVRFPVERQSGPFTEALTWAFSGITSDGATVALDWGTVHIPVEVEVTPTYSLTFDQARAAAYLGRYSFTWAMGPPEANAKAIDFYVTYENGSLMGRWDPSPWAAFGSMWERFVLIPIEKDWFIAGFLDGGALYDVERGMVIEFALKGGKATGFEVRGEDDKVVARGERKS